MARHKPTQERYEKMYKMNFKGKKVFRNCLGVICRGEKKFWSQAGARICKKCALLIENVSNDEAQRIYFR